MKEIGRNPQAIDACRADLFTNEDDLRKIYCEQIVRRVLRVREEYQWFLSNPEAKDRQFVEAVMSRHGINRSQAYSDLAIVKALLPHLSEATRDFHRFRYNEMIIETFQMAKKRKDTKTMEKAASSYAKFNRVDLDDEQAVPYDMIVVQPFTATDDPSVLGIKPIPNINERISELIKKYRAENIDIEDIEFEEADLEWNSLLPAEDDDNSRKENIL